MEREFLMLIGEQWQEAQSREKFKVINPATSEVIAEVPKGDRADTAKALEAANKAYKN